MKPFVLKSLVGAALLASLAILSVRASAQTDSTAAAEATPPPLGSTPAGPSTPTPAASSESSKGKKGKTPRNPNEPTPTPKQRKAKEIPFPVPVGKDVRGLRLPSYDQLGKVLSVITAVKATPIDGEHVRMDGMKFDMNETGGKDEYKVEMPTCILNLKTNIVTSDQAVVIRTKDFELTGERVEFNTVEQTGTLQGHVHMVIHNLKQVATPGQPLPET